jgi:hypothetical protein
MKKDKNYFLMNIKDKIKTDDIFETESPRYCPPHRIPHTLPLIGELITDEPCHHHTSKLRMIHHKTFCKILRCPNYKTMIKAYNKSK